MTKEVSFLRSLTIQGRVMHALMMREVITRFGRDNLGVLWVVAEPMIFTLGITALWTLAGLNHGSSLPIAAFDEADFVVFDRYGGSLPQVIRSDGHARTPGENEAPLPPIIRKEAVRVKRRSLSSSP